MSTDPVILSPEHSRYLRALAKALGAEIPDLLQYMIFQASPSNHIDHFLEDWDLSESEKTAWKHVKEMNESQADPWDWQEFSELIEL